MTTTRPVDIILGDRVRFDFDSSTIEGIVKETAADEGVVGIEIGGHFFSCSITFVTLVARRVVWRPSYDGSERWFDDGTNGNDGMRYPPVGTVRGGEIYVEESLWTEYQDAVNALAVAEERLNDLVRRAL